MLYLSIIFGTELDGSFGGQEYVINESEPDGRLYLSGLKEILLYFDIY